MKLFGLVDVCLFVLLDELSCYSKQKSVYKLLIIPGKSKDLWNFSGNAVIFNCMANRMLLHQKILRAS